MMMYYALLYISDNYKNKRNTVCIIPITCTRTQQWAGIKL